MKIYISADIEGITGVTSWDEAKSSHPDYGPYRTQMTREVRAAAEAALRAGAKEILLKDAHATGRNLNPADFPTAVKFVKGWSGHPLCMVQELDRTFAAVLMIGYHSRAGSNGNPLAHTMSSSRFAEIRINDQPVSEFALHGMAAATLGVPVAFVSGDEALGREVKGLNENIGFVPVMRGVGASTISIHPELALKNIAEGVESSLHSDLRKCLLPLAKTFQTVITFHDHMTAYRASYYPGCKYTSEHSIRHECTDFMDVMRMINFV